MSRDQEDSPAPEIVIVRRRSGDEDGGHHGGVWKIAYADFMTAMMAFFLVMWLVNSTDQETLAQIANYFNPLKLTDSTAAKKGMRNLDAGEGRDPDLPKVSVPKNDDLQGKTFGAATDGDRSEPGTNSSDTEGRSAVPAGGEQADDQPGGSPRIVLPHTPAATPEDGRVGEADDPFGKRAVALPGQPPGAPPVASAVAAARMADADAAGQRLERTRAELEAAFAALPPNIAGNVAVTLTDAGLLISLMDSAAFEMFAVGTAQPRPELALAMARIAPVLAGQPQPIVIRGHTDGRPFRADGNGNWRLSTDRAQAAYLLLLRGGVDESKFVRVEGHADRDLKLAGDPLAAQNRRIELLLMRR